MARAVFGAIEHDKRQLGAQSGQKMRVGERMIEIGKGIEYGDAVTPEAALRSWGKKRMTVVMSGAADRYVLLIVRYKRADGVPLSGTLYLPPDGRRRAPAPDRVGVPARVHRPGHGGPGARLAPYTFTPPPAAPRRSSSSRRATPCSDDATMPIVGDPRR